jgi:hypothetical protein
VFGLLRETEGTRQNCYAMPTFPKLFVTTALGVRLRSSGLRHQCVAAPFRDGHRFASFRCTSKQTQQPCIHECAALFACVPTVKQLISLRYYVSHPSTHILTAGFCSFVSCFLISCRYHLFCLSVSFILLIFFPLYFAQFSLISFSFVSLLVYCSTSPPFKTKNF